MTDKLTLDDVENEAADRDENGELIPDEEEIEWGDGTKTIRVYPLTGGIGNKIAKHEHGLEELEPRAVAAVISAACPDLEHITADYIESLPIDKIRALLQPIEEQMPEPPEREERGN